LVKVSNREQAMPPESSRLSVAASCSSASTPLIVAAPVDDAGIGRADLLHLDVGA
jgi:hypothetical protein